MKKLMMILMIAVMCVSSFHAPAVVEASKKKKPTYTIKPSSKPYNKKMTKFSAYNKHTKHYYLLRSYMERLEKTGGGTLILKKGTYTISTVIHVPSNVTIRLKNGVKIVKGKKNGNVKNLKISNTIFQFIRPSRGMKKAVYGKYKGEKNISIIGEGTAIIDLKKKSGAIAIVAGHNQNIRIQNIRFQNAQDGHFLEVDATNNITIVNCQFRNNVGKKSTNKEAINLDTPDKKTNGFGHAWSKMDRTPNKNVYILNNRFYNIDRAIGTHKYSQGKRHNKIVIRNNRIEKTREDAIRVMNWSNSIIENNTIKNVANKRGTYRAIFASGAINPTFRNNTFEQVARPIVFMPWKNNGSGSSYAIIYDKLSAKNKEALKTNRIRNYRENFIRIERTYKLHGADLERIPIRTF